MTDNLSGLVWEKKTNLDSTTNFADPHDADNTYTWSTSSPYAENGTAFTNFLAALNSGAGFAGANGWRLPTFSELQTILQDFSCTGAGAGPRCTCASSPCVDTVFGPTQFSGYWSATSYFPYLGNAWYVYFFGVGFVSFNDETFGDHVRAARGGL